MFTLVSIFRVSYLYTYCQQVQKFKILPLIDLIASQYGSFSFLLADISGLISEIHSILYSTSVQTNCVHTIVHMSSLNTKHVCKICCSAQENHELLHSATRLRRPHWIPSDRSKEFRIAGEYFLGIL